MMKELLIDMEQAAARELEQTNKLTRCSIHYTNRTEF